MNYFRRLLQHNREFIIKEVLEVKGLKNLLMKYRYSGVLLRLINWFARLYISGEDHPLHSLAEVPSLNDLFAVLLVFNQDVGEPGLP